MVCNDGYAKPLFCLKDIVLKHRVYGARKERIEERLTEILKLEGIRNFSNTVRHAIIEQSNGDARSAITRAQMIACNRKLTEGGGDNALKVLAAQADVAKLQMKDLSQSIFDVVENVLGGRTEQEVKRAQDSNKAIREMQEVV